MMRWLLLALLLFSASPAYALFGGSATPVPVCPSPTGTGSTITPLNTSCTLLDVGSNVWQFTNVASGSNFFLNFNGAADFVGTQAQRCSTGRIARTEIVNLQTLAIYWTGAFDVQGPSICSPSFGNFVDVTTSNAYDSFLQATQSIAGTNTLHVLALPAGVPFYFDGGTITTNSATVNVDSGVIFSNFESPSPPGQGQLVIQGNSATINGGTWSNVPDDAIRVDNSATNPTFENLTIHDCGASCFLSGNGNATVTLSNVTVFHGGKSLSGQDHNVYVSALVGSGDSVANTQITALDSYDVCPGAAAGCAWPLKMRPLGVNTENHVTQSYVDCQTSNCSMNGSVDMPCGGQYLLDFNTIEANFAQWYSFRYMEEQIGPVNCPSRAATNTLTIDHEIIIWDGITTGLGHPVLACLGTQPGTGVCNNNVAVGTTCTISNSVIVSDSGNGATFDPTTQGNSPGCTVGGGTTGCTYAAGKCTDPGNNRWYTTRAIAAANEGWLNTTDHYGNTCTVANSCVWPYTPNHM